MDSVFRVQRVIEATRRVAEQVLRDDGGLCTSLVSATHLSREGVELAVREHLETEPSEEEVHSLVASAGRAGAAHVVLSANVFTAGARALALAVATAPRVFVRCSRREEVFVPALIEAIGAGLEGIERPAAIAPSPGDELHLYGSDATLRTICAGLAAGVRVRAHGTGIGLSLVGSDADPREVAGALARDMVPFDQRGCLSPRAAIVRGPAAAHELAEALRDELDAWRLQVPPGPADAALLVELTAFRELASAVGDWVACGDGGIAVAQGLRAPWFAPSGRNLLVVAFDDDDAAARWVTPMAHHVASLGVSGDERAWPRVSQACAGARRSAIGRMQKPRFDGPVDRRHPGVETPSQVLERLGPDDSHR